MKLTIPAVKKPIHITRASFNSFCALYPKMAAILFMVVGRDNCNDVFNELLTQKIVVEGKNGATK